MQESHFPKWLWIDRDIAVSDINIIRSNKSLTGWWIAYTELKELESLKTMQYWVKNMVKFNELHDKHVVWSLELAYIENKQGFVTWCEV